VHKEKSDSELIFLDYLRSNFPVQAESLMERFSLFLELLYSQNQKVNLVSRQMSKEDYWLYHFLDSLLVLNCIDFYQKEVLDFGTGGGLPGIPVKLVYPEIKMTLLDSVSKKVRCIENIIDSLHLENCQVVWSRIEDYAKSGAQGRYDYILCRSVRMEPGFIEPIGKLLKPSGKAVFYKAPQIDDVAALPDINVIDVSRDELGKRQIVLAPQKSFVMYLTKKKLG